MDSTTAKNPKRIWQTLTALAILVGTFLRFWRLGRLSLWFDEGYTAWMVNHPVKEIIRLVRADTSPPLYYLLLHYWTRLFGNSEAGLRSMSACFSVGTLLLGIDIARRLQLKPAMIAATAWLLALGFMNVEYAQEARGYALMALCAAAAMDVLLIYLASGQQRWLGVLVILLTAGLYTHPMMGPLTVGICLAWLTLPAEMGMRRRIVDMCIVAGTAAGLFFPWALGVLPEQIRLVNQDFWVTKPALWKILETMVSLQGIQHFGTWDGFLWRMHLPGRPEKVPVILGGWILLGALWLGRRSRAGWGMMLAGLAPVALIGGWSWVGKPIFMDKVLLPSAVFLPIALAAMLRGRVGAWVMVGLLILTAASVVGFLHEDVKEDWRGVAAVVRSIPQPAGGGRLIVFVCNDGQLPFDYYYGEQPGDDIEETGAPAGFFDRNPPRTMLRVHSAEDLRPLLENLRWGDWGSVVLITSHTDWGDPHGLTLSMLSQRFQRRREWHVQLIDIYEFEHDPWWYKSPRFRISP